jgi:TM2 domain-containing membrane protein YozV
MTDPYTNPSAPQPSPGPPDVGYPQYSGPQPVAAPGYPTHQGTMVAPKSPGVALIASFFIPGLGSMINGDVGKGLFILIGYIISWLLVIVIIGVFGLFGFWIYGMVDAYNGARLWNARHGIIS